MKILQNPLRQSGVTLIELMVGLVIGMLVVVTAMGTLMVSRGISSTVSDASGIQQQGAYILRMIGQQLRQVGSLYLNPDPTGGGSTDVLSPVAFEIQADAVGTGNSYAQEDALVGDEDTVTIGFRSTRTMCSKLQVQKPLALHLPPSVLTIWHATVWVPQTTAAPINGSKASSPLPMTLFVAKAIVWAHLSR